ncbi:hypothetical protein POTOM_061844 [Populus tomentosa]|uniref:AP180 N-terminal homology (ANTH) domain-containing protein n=1 Tax=Populus tomentosa TaxID=118781 RepID=A0A8X8BY49_POPTO|nr:hypothetical protein POTOM_061844 [Populus tomentosa]
MGLSRTQQKLALQRSIVNTSLGLLCMGSTYALFLEERWSVLRFLKYDIEAERLNKASPVAIKVHSKTRLLNGEDLLEQLPALQQLLFRLLGCQPEGGAYNNYLIQYALALAENLAEFYEHCKGLELARNFQFPTLRQPPLQLFLQQWKSYVKEAPQSGSVPKRLEYTENEPEEPEGTFRTCMKLKRLMMKNTDRCGAEETKAEEEVVEPPLGLNEINPKAAELEESNAMALANCSTCDTSLWSTGVDPLSSSNALSELGKPNATGWELALVTTPSNPTSQPMQSKMGGGLTGYCLIAYMKMILQGSKYKCKMQGTDMVPQLCTIHLNNRTICNIQQHSTPNKCADDDDGSTAAAVPTAANDDATAPQQNQSIVVPCQHQPQYPQKQMQQVGQMGTANPFADPFSMFWGPCLSRTGVRWRCSADRVGKPGNAGAGGVFRDHHGDSAFSREIKEGTSFEFSGDSGVLANQELVIEPGSQSGISVEAG